MIVDIIYHWAEAWASLIPLYIYVLKKPTNKYLEIISCYLLTAFCINIIEVISWRFHDCMPSYLRNNNFLYNLNSIIRIIFFVSFLKNSSNIFPRKLYDLFLIGYLIFFTFYFIINKNFGTLSSILHASESLSLLILCISYFIKLIKSDQVFVFFDPYLLIISGLAIYESVNFFVYLFYQYLPDTKGSFAHNIWYVVDVSFIIFCLFISKAFYGRSKSRA